MENKEFFYVDNEQQLGPVTLLELQNLNLSSNTLIWYEDLADWTELKNIEQLSNLVRFQKIPPPIPNKQQKKFETEVSGELRLKKDIEVNENIEKLKPSRKTFRRFVIWTGIHIFILLMSYSQIDLFNSSKPRTDEFWPFVKIAHKYKNFEKDYSNTDFFGSPSVVLVEEWSYRGLFYNYDWSEFLVYVGGAFLIFIIKKLSDKKEEDAVVS